MQVTMQHAERLTLAEMREFLVASNSLSFAGTGRKQIYGLVEGVLRAQKYLGLPKKDSLKEGISAARMEQQALRMSDTECALRMQQRKRKLLDACRSRG